MDDREIIVIVIIDRRRLESDVGVGEVSVLGRFCAREEGELEESLVL